MVMKPSSRERFERRARELALVAAKNPDSGTPRKTRVRAKRVVVPKRVKLVWKVFNEGFKEMACFPYPEESRAREKAAALTKKTGKTHFVNGVKVAMADAE